MTAWRLILIALTVATASLPQVAAAADFLDCRSKGAGRPASDATPGEIRTFDETDLGSHFSISLAKREMIIHEDFDDTETHLALESSMRASGDLVMHFLAGPSAGYGPYLTTIIFSEATGVYQESRRDLSRNEILHHPDYHDWARSFPNVADKPADSNPISSLSFSWGMCSFVS